MWADFYPDEDNNSNSSMVFIPGEYTDEGRTHEFTLVEMYDSNSDSYSYEVTWIEGKPLNVSKVEKFIIEQWNE